MFISGVLYDLQIRDSDDIGWMGKLTEALKTKGKMSVSNRNGHFLVDDQGLEAVFQIAESL